MKKKDRNRKKKLIKIILILVGSFLCFLMIYKNDGDFWKCIIWLGLRWECFIVCKNVKLINGSL